MRRVISKTAFILKGSGWYVTDYPSDERKKGMEGEKPLPAVDVAGAKKEAVATEQKSVASEKKESASAEKKPATAEKKSTPPSPNTGGKSEAKKKR